MAGPHYTYKDIKVMLNKHSLSEQKWSAKIYTRYGQRNTTTPTRTFILTKVWQNNVGSLQQTFTFRQEFDGES